jgi:hypothetical protein
LRSFSGKEKDDYQCKGRAEPLFRLEPAAADNPSIA